MSANQWKCTKCGKVGGFGLLGGGFIMCTSCGAWYCVLPNGQLLRVGRTTPQLLPTKK